jgi:transcriptional regulator of acetoin/glycerol metabolism
MPTPLCPGCEFAIPTRCRRCKRPFAKVAELHAEVASLREKLAALEVVKPVPQLFPDPLPSAWEWEQLLIAEALRQHGNPIHAAPAIGMGKTTLYRKIKGVA